MKTCFENMGFTNVATYIQSGNVIISSEEGDQIMLKAQIGKVLYERFNYSLFVLIFSHQQLKSVIEKATDEFDLNSETHKYDVVFLKLKGPSKSL